MSASHKQQLPCRITPSNIETKCKNCRREPSCDNNRTKNDLTTTTEKSDLKLEGFTKETNLPENYSYFPRANDHNTSQTDERSNAANLHVIYKKL